jgi:asparagine synthase (glutamine-hydrolysing)
VCGIAGILRTWRGGEAPGDTFEAIPEAWLDVLDESIKHRGPDGCGRFRQRVRRGEVVVDVALVHRRLSIIDHAGGAQPMVIGSCATVGSSASVGRVGTRNTGGQAASGTDGARHGWDSRATMGPLISREGLPYGPVRAHVCPKCGPGLVAVVFNGCIYNHRELRRELEAAGHEFASDHSDTEVLVHGWREWVKLGHWAREGLCARLEGMYSFVAWDGTGRYLKLEGGRDPFGEKPLYDMRFEHGRSMLEAWCSSAAGLAGLSREMGASQARAIKARSAVRWVRYGYGRRVMRGISQAAPEGESDAGWALWRMHWRRPEEPPPERRLLSPRMWATPSADSAEWVDAEPLTVDSAERLLAEAVRERLETDVPLGCFLSGGIDSSLIAALARREIPELRTFCVRMPDARYDESAKAAAVAEHLGTVHETVEVATDPASDLIDLIRTLGVPFGDSSLLPATWLCRAVRERVKVALAGDGGDELFLGYQRYVGAEVLRRRHGLLGLLPLGTAGQGDAKSRLGKLSRLVQAARAGNQYEMHAVFNELTLTRLLGEQGRRRVRGKIGTPRWGASAYRSWDLVDYLPDDLLRKTDAASMRHALEVRCPFLDHRLLLAALDTPVDVLMPGGRRKGLLREVARRHVTDEIADAPKMGFAIPIGEWFRSDYGGMRQLLYDHLESADPFPGLAEAGVELDMDFVRRMLAEHDAAGEKSLNPWHGRDHSQRLYMLLVLSIWCRWLRGVGG